MASSCFHFRRGLATLYVNGIEKGTVPSGFQFNNVETGIGAKWINLYGNSVSGFIDDVAVWDKPLFPDTIASLAAGTPPNAVVDSPKNLALRWPASGGYFSMESAFQPSKRAFQKSSNAKQHAPNLPQLIVINTQHPPREIAVGFFK